MITSFKASPAPHVGAATRTALLIAAALVATAMLAGCGDSEEPAPTPAQPRTADEDRHRAKWLDHTNPLTPAQWIASRNAPQIKLANDPDVVRIAVTLDHANKLYRESERMIANRAVQLEDMLLALGLKEDAASILEDLSQVAGEAGQTEGFGAISQHYFNLRTSNMDRGEALAALKNRYGLRP